MNDMFVWFVSYRRYADDKFDSTNLVHARCSANIDREFGGCAWYSMRAAREYEIEPARAKGMPERWL